MIDTLETVPKERWLEEFKKLADSPKPSVGLNLAWNLGIFEKHFPMFKAFKTTHEHAEHHPEGDTWTHTMMVVDEVAKGKYPFVIFLAALCHDLGKPAVNVINDKGFWSQPGHSEAGVNPTKEFLWLLNVDNDTKEKVVILVKEHLAPAVLTSSTRPMKALRRLANRLHPATLEELWALAMSDMLGRGTTMQKKLAKALLLDELLELAREAQIHNKKPENIVTGKELIAAGIQPGVMMGRMISVFNNLHEEFDLTKDQLLKSLEKNT